MIKLVPLLCLAAACSVHHAAMDPSKLDPAFAALIAAQKGPNPASYPLPSPVDENRSGDEKSGKRYECIVYTKQAGALRQTGIVIHSTLPGFVTAWATVRQLEQLASMPEVTYIESPKTNFPQQQSHAP
ncbi:MAG: hypothetical protein INR73_28060 [Williamsia sp.]|nr:hypothetical protein [Williamsia sp.]